MKGRWVLVGLAVAVAALVPSIGRAASPEGGSVGPSNGSVSWTGGPFLLDPIVCVGPEDPTCDHYALTVEEYTGHAAVTVGVEGDGDDVDVDLEVYRGSTMVGSSARRGADEVILWDPAPGAYEVRVMPYTARGATYSGTATFAPVVDPPSFEGDVDQDCLDPAPDHAGVPAITDNGRNVALNVLVLLDSGVPQSEGEEMIAVAQAKTYDGVRVTLNATYEAVSFPSDGDYDSGSFGGVRGTAEGTRLIEDAKAHVGGKATGDIDVVYVLSNKDLWNVDAADGSKSYGLLGVADCIGGIRYDDRSFVVGEWITGDAYSFVIDENVPSRAVRVYGRLTSKIFSHELGHILGAHHHYGNCAQGVSGDDMLLADVAPCTLMFPDATLISHEFGSLEAAVVRGYTANHA